MIYGKATRTSGCTATAFINQIQQQQQQQQQQAPPQITLVNIIDLLVVTKDWGSRFSYRHCMHEVSNDAVSIDVLSGGSYRFN